MSEYFRQRLKGLFGKQESSDCVVKFVLEGSSKAPRRSAARPSSGRGASAALRQVGELLPALELVLCGGSPFFDAQLQRWKQLSGQSKNDSGTAPSAAQNGRKRKAPQQSEAAQEADTPAEPELLVHLRSEDEHPAALAAIKFIYTDSLEPGMGCAELLRVRRQAGYLQVEGCVAACDKALLERVQENGAVALELHRCEDLFPQPEEEAAGFAAVLEAAKPSLLPGLLADFRSALRVCNSRKLRERFGQLPAGAVEALLESDDLPTDDESSVLFLVICWRKANPRVATDVHRRLCRLVRVSQLSDSYLAFALYPMSQCPSFRFPISLGEVQFVREFKAAGGAGAFRGMANARYSGEETRWYAGPRSQAIPVTGMAFRWTVPRQKLADAAIELASNKSKEQTYVATNIVLPSGETVEWAFCRGWKWSVTIRIERGSSHLGVYLFHAIPEELASFKPMGAVAAFARVSVHRWRGASREVGCRCEFGREHPRVLQGVIP